jgi:hypothetical protein
LTRWALLSVLDEYERLNVFDCLNGCSSQVGSSLGKPDFKVWFDHSKHREVEFINFT